MTDNAENRIANIGKANRLLRSLVVAVLIAGALLLALLIWLLATNTRASNDLFGVLQGVDSGFNILLLMGASLFFLNGLENRNKANLP